MTAYVIALVNVTDPDRYKEYSTLAAPAVKQYGGRFLVRGGVIEVLEGAFPFQRLVINEFPDAEQARRFYHSPEYQEARRRRLVAAEFNMIVAEGFTG